ncbi:MAG TPA: hypothetical protein VGI70_07985 [Polyangiales bacterium]|jgi:hypothetical protein
MRLGDSLTLARRRLTIALGIYALSTIVFFLFADPAVIHEHTPWNHFALLADAWRHGRLDLGGPPPAYTGNNDFARFENKYFVVFPPFPALLLLPVVALANAPERVQDGKFFLLLAGIAPAVLFLALEKLRRFGRAEISERVSVLFAFSFGFGSVYFFSAEQGTVWFAAHVVAGALAALYLLFALEAEKPWLAGLALACAFATRTPLLFAAPLFVLEALRVSSNEEAFERRDWKALFASLDRARFLRLLVQFALPIAAVLALTLWYDQARFHDPFEVGYQYLGIAWQRRIQKWGLFSYHYLAKNLGVLLTSLPYRTPGGSVPFQINAHGLALWFTTPLFLWLLWPRKTRAPHLALWLTVACVAVPTLFYQNTGWLQFGYRFSNDYAPFLFALLAIGGYRLGRLFWVAAVWAVLINAFGAATFGRPSSAAYYFQENTQRVLYQPD